MNAFVGMALAGFEPLARIDTWEMSRRLTFMRSRMKVKSSTFIVPKSVRSVTVEVSFSLRRFLRLPAVTQSTLFERTSAAFCTMMSIF